ncbi:MAG TPA: hypothetical protein PLX30_02950, partial [Methanothrix sp.]|nr:hypothetical protein [Methanothrix sp.]
TSGYSDYSWSVVSGPATIISGSATSAITWNAGGPGSVNFSVSVTDGNGCSNTCYRTVEVYSLPDCTITALPGVCSYSEENGANTTSGYVSYSWSVVSGPATITSGSATSAITWNAGGPGTVNFSVSVTGAGGCTDICYKEVTVHQSPTVDAGPDRYLYGFDASVDLSPTVTGGTPKYSYTWTDQGIIINKDGDENLSVSSPGTYVIAVTDENGCYDSDSVNVTEVVPDIMVTKTASPKAGGPCTNVTFTITVTNTGKVPLDLEVIDTIPTGMSYVSANPAPDSVVENANGTWTVVWESHLTVLGPGNSTQILLVAHIDEDIVAPSSTDGMLTVLGSSEDEVLRIQQAGSVTPEKLQELEWMRVRLEVELKKMIELRSRFDKDAADLKVETPLVAVGAGYSILNYTNPITGESLVLFEDGEGNLEFSEYINPELNAVLTSEYGPGGVLVSDSYLSRDGMEGLRIDYNLPSAGYKVYTVTSYETGDTLIDTFDPRGNLVNREYRRTPGIAREVVFTVQNCVTAIGTYEAGQVSDSDCADVTITYRSDLKLTKTPSPTMATVGTNVLYTYLVENTGATTITNLTLFDDKINKFVSLNRTVLKPGEFAEGTALYTVLSGDLPGPILNNATVTGTDPQGGEVKDIDTATVPLYYSEIVLVKTPDKTVVGVGDVVTYTYVVTNVGTTTISNLTLFDDKIDRYLNLSKTVLAPNETATATGEYTAQSSDLPGPILNNATVEGTDEMDAPISAEDDASVDISENVTTVEKVANRTVVGRGEEVAYTIKVCNSSEIFTVNDTFNRDVELVSADPWPTSLGDRWQSWDGLTIPANNNCLYITLVVRIPKQDFTFDMEHGVEGEGFVNVANDYNTAPPDYLLVNSVEVTNKTGSFLNGATETVLVRDLGTELATREHGSGSYESEEVVHMRTENKSISMEKDMAATYKTTTLGLYNNRTVTYSSKWTEEAKAKNRATGASLTESYRYADYIDRVSRFDLDENGSVMEFETEFSGMGHVGALKKSDPNDTARDTPIFELDENYVGTFRVYDKVDEYGENVEYEASSSGDGFVASDRRVGDSQRSYEHGSGSYDYEGQISAITNYMAKDISLVSGPTSQGLTDDVSVNSSLKWKEGMYSKNKGVSYIGEEYTSIDRLDKESIFRGLNDLSTEADFSGTARYRIILADASDNGTGTEAMIDFDDIYSGDYSVARKLVLTGVPKYDRPHLSVAKTGSARTDSSLVDYTITVTNDGNVVLDTISIEDTLPQGTEFLSASLRPNPAETTSERVMWDILSLPVGDVLTIDLVLNVTDYQGHLVNVVKATAQHGENLTLSATNFSILDPSWLSCCPSEIFASKTAAVDPVLQNVVTYKLSVQNQAEKPVVARIDDEIPGGMKLLGSSAMPSEYDESTGHISWVVTDLAPGELRSIDYLVEARYDGRYVNVARVDPYTIDGQELDQVTVSSVVSIGPFEGEVPEVPPGWVPPDWDLEYYSYGCISGMSCEEIS